MRKMPFHWRYDSVILWLNCQLPVVCMISCWYWWVAFVLWQRIYARPEVGVFTTLASATVLHHNTSPDFLEEVQKCLFMDIVQTCNFNNDMLVYLCFLRYLACCLCYFYEFNLATVKPFKPPNNDTILKQILTSWSFDTYIIYLRH